MSKEIKKIHYNKLLAIIIYIIAVSFLISGCSSQSKNQQDKINSLRLEINLLKTKVSGKTQALEDIRNEGGLFNRLFNEGKKAKQLKNEINSMQNRIDNKKQIVQKIQSNEKKHGMGWYLIVGLASVVAVILAFIAAVAIISMGVGFIVILALSAGLIGIGWVVSFFL